MNRKLVKDERLSYFMIVKTPSFYSSKVFKQDKINSIIFEKIRLKGGEMKQQNLKRGF
jgi:hypothetical protein